VTPLLLPKDSWGRIGLAALTGLLLALSFPRPGLAILAWVAFIPLLVVTRQEPVRRVFRLAFLSGFVAYCGIFYWLNIVMITYGKLPPAVSIFLSLVMAAYLALYVAAAFALARRAEESGIPRVVGLPLFWVALEYLRALLLTGFPWASLGYSQFRTLPLIQIADLTGVYGLSFLIILANVVLFRIVRGVRGVGDERYPLAAALFLTALLAGCISYGFVRMNGPENGTLVKVALAQGNIPQDVKWDPAFQESTVAIYERLSRQGAGRGWDLVVWPESSLPFYFQSEPLYSRRITSLAAELKTALVVSSPALEGSGSELRLLNSAYLIGPDGSSLGRADKVHLVPFGEYVPLARLLPFVHKMVEGIGDFSPGRVITPLVAPFGKLGVLVCFEGIFPEISRAYVQKGAQLLVNITNDAWFGNSSAPYQHLSMTVFRAVENRVPLVRAANTGITAIIDSQGHIRGMTGLFREGLLSGEIRLGGATPFYTRYGDLFAWLCLLGALAACLAPVVKLRRRPE
jgi:apolipoprotein N-acyltransferase